MVRPRAIPTKRERNSWSSLLGTVDSLLEDEFVVPGIVLLEDLPHKGPPYPSIHGVERCECSVAGLACSCLGSVTGVRPVAPSTAPASRAPGRHLLLDLRMCDGGLRQLGTFVRERGVKLQTTKAVYQVTHRCHRCLSSGSTLRKPLAGSCGARWLMALSRSRTLRAGRRCAEVVASPNSRWPPKLCCR